MFSKNLLQFLMSVPDASGTYFGMMLKQHLNNLINFFDSDYKNRHYYHNAAKERLLEYIKASNLSITPSEAITAIQKRFRDSDLTINFKLDLLLDDTLTASDEHFNAYMLTNDGLSPEYLEKRNKAEQYYFNFSETETLDNPETQRSRPHYAALNYANNPSGSSPGYGSGFFKLKSAVKHRCTFSSEDTYTVYDCYLAFLRSGKIPQLQPKGLISGYHNLTHLISTLNDNQLDYLIGSKREEYMDADAFYIEAHVHSNLDWNKDVEALVLVEDVEVGGKSLNAYTEEEQEIIIQNATNFARKHNIDCYITDAKGIITSYLYRKEESGLKPEVKQVKTEVWNSDTWKGESFRFFKPRSEQTKKIGSLVKTYESIADQNNLTARLFVISELQIALVDWLHQKPQGARASTMLILLDQVLKEQHALTESIADILEADANPILKIS
ncbi:Protein of uncharacterised function (DUF3626) [Legionella wadsworthii]|uniref:Protein of uncharacterized function (DUF3626) n=1 Tax=Legionella wadsworthii TaxID=28088 RepID=A0A378LNI8_9GAMM|nr:DUF3626 domain-containing protein [Legionella wadsworthii]STY28323.1 Protein of uncharacterised function (DUF3626) [Legionella wadsworthii]